MRFQNWHLINPAALQDETKQVAVSSTVCDVEDRLYFYATNASDIVFESEIMFYCSFSAKIWFVSENQNGRHFQEFSADSHLLWLDGHMLRGGGGGGGKWIINIAPKQTRFQSFTLSPCLSGRLFSLSSSLPHSPHGIIWLFGSVIKLTQSLLTNSEIKCPSFFIHERRLISGIVRLWMNRCNILEAVYLFFVFFYSAIYGD